MEHPELVVFPVPRASGLPGTRDCRNGQSSPYTHQEAVQGEPPPSLPHVRPATPKVAGLSCGCSPWLPGAIRDTPPILWRSREVQGFHRHSPGYSASALRAPNSRALLPASALPLGPIFSLG